MPSLDIPPIVDQQAPQFDTRQPIAAIPLERAAGTDRVGLMGAVAAAWGVLSHMCLLLVAVLQLATVAMDGLTAGALGAWEWLLAAATLVLMGYFQGYRGFQRGYAPLVVARAFHLARYPRAVHALLAPMYCMCLVHASRRRIIATWILVATMIVLAMLVGILPEPYRAIVDLSVAFGLAWGAAALAVFALRAIAGRPPATPLDLPAGAAR